MPAPSARLSAANIGGYALAAAALIAASLTQRRPRGKPVVEWSDLDDLMAERMRTGAHVCALVPSAGLMLCEYTADPRTTLLRPRRLSGLDCSTGGEGREIAPLRTTSTTSASMNRRGSLCSLTCMCIRCKRHGRTAKSAPFQAIMHAALCAHRTPRSWTCLVWISPRSQPRQIWPSYQRLLRFSFLPFDSTLPSDCDLASWPCVCWQAGLIFSGSNFSVLGIRPHGLERATVQHEVAS